MTLQTPLQTPLAKRQTPLQTHMQTPLQTRTDALHTPPSYSPLRLRGLARAFTTHTDTAALALRSRPYAPDRTRP
jgi:hypothetical protein